MSLKMETTRKFNIGFNAGIGASYTDRAYLLNTPASLSFDFRATEQFFVQFAPKYSWLLKWNEHYLTLPLHLGIMINKRFSFFAGPALTFDIGYFKDLGISAGVYYHFGKRSAIVLSANTFTLYDYNINYLYVPIGLTYNYMILK